MTILDNVNKDHGLKILKMKNDVEALHGNETTRRGMRAKANAGVSGYALFGDNVGKIINPR